MDTMNYIEHITENPLDWSEIKSNTTMDFMEFMDYIDYTDNNTENNNIQTTIISIDLQECYEESYNNYNAKEEEDENVV